MADKDNQGTKITDDQIANPSDLKAARESINAAIEKIQTKDRIPDGKPNDLNGIDGFSK